MIDTCFKITISSYYPFYFISPMVFSTPLIHLILSKRSTTNFGSASISTFPDLDILYDSLSINLGPSRDSTSELLIRSSKIFLYLLKITVISKFSSSFLITCLKTCFLKIITIQF